MAATGFLRAGIVFAVLLGIGTVRAADPLPRFTEEREAAARFFIRKHCPELLPLLDELKKNNRRAYELQVRETFQITEFLTDLQDDPKRYDIELRSWKAENRALVLVGRLAAAGAEDRQTAEDQLRTLARELVELELQGYEHRIAVIEREAAAARTDLAKARDRADQTAREKYERYREEARRKRGP